MGDLMFVSGKMIKFVLGTALGLLSAGSMAAQNDASTVVAEIGGVKVTMGELEQEESGRLLSAHYQKIARTESQEREPHCGPVGAAGYRLSGERPDRRSNEGLL
jgi:hypothetical protein